MTWLNVHELSQYFGIIDMFARHMPLVETEQGLDHWPNLYSGTVTFLLLPMYFLNGKISLRKKLASGLLLLFFYLSFSINILNFIWHGLHYPNSLPCRQSFLYIFMLLCLCYEAYLKRKATGLRELGISLASALSFIILCQKVVTDDAFHWAVFYTAILFVLLYYLLFYLEKKGGLNYNALLLSALALLGMECAINMAATSVTTTSRTSYTADNADTIRLVRAARAEDKSFCRFEKMTRKTKDDGAFLNFPSVSIFSSTAYKECSDFFRKIGCEASTNAYSITGSTPLVNMLFSVKYDIYSEEPAAAEKRGLSYRDGSGEMLLYQNEYSLPPGLFLREEELTNWHTDMGTPALVQNSFCDAMQSSPVLIPVIGNFQEKDYSFTADTAGEYYVYVTNPKLKQVKAKLASGEKSFENVDRGYFLELGYLSEGEEVRLTADTAGQSMDCEAYRFDFTALKELYRKLSGRSWEPKLHTDTKLSGSATPSEDSTLLLFVPYDEGWSARVDGRKVKPVKALNCFLGIPLDAGVHEITLSYFPKGLFLGILCSILSLCLFLLLFFLSRRSW
ncbi:MAG: YfhO family protein, partial [Oribacterium sp.]